MPRPSGSAQEGTVLRWLVDDGAAVTRGDAIVEIEIDTATVTCAADADGILRRAAAEGDTLPLGALLATIEDDEPGGAEPPVVETGTAKGDVRVQELTRTQRIAVRRAAEAKAIIPEHTLEMVVDMEACAALRARLEATADPVPTYGDMVVAATARALRDVPRANGAYRDERFELYSRVNVGIALAGEDGLVVPTIFDADRKGLVEIAAETRKLAQRVRDGVITPPELSGATFTVHDLGRLGVSRSTAILTPPQAGALAVGAVEPAVVARDGQPAIRRQATLTLTADHRILDGAVAARLLGRIRALLEEPGDALA
jgi:pyruvate dehydrogenase E2 component (dihydrolipoamide acetyltransferase)